MVLAVMWTLVVAAYGWLNLPRARHIPHDPQFLTRLSSEAASILRGPLASAKPVRGALVWSEDPRSVRMSNGTQLFFPAITTDARAELVAGEYRAVLNAEAAQQRVPYVLEMLALWLAPLVAAGLALRVARRGHDVWRMVPEYVRQRTDYYRENDDHRLHDGTPASPA